MPDLSLENACNGLVCGIDEAGRGPLAGPVVAACVHIPAVALTLPFWAKVTDSKKLTAARRQALFDDIRTHTQYGIAEASAAEIDDMNIHKATLLAMRRAFIRMPGATGMAAALVDGKFTPELPCAAQAVVKGDSKSLSIAAASILAKVTRDRIMHDLHTVHPHYGWAQNAGYPTALHMQAVQAHGITPHHRRSYRPIREIVEAA